MVRLGRVPKSLITANFLIIALSLVGLTLAGSACAFNYVADANGTWWGIQDDALPHVDTGSIRATQVGPGQSLPFSTSINGFGGLKVLVETAVYPGSTNPRFNGELMRGFGLQFDGVSRFTTTQSNGLAGVDDLPLGLQDQTTAPTGLLARMFHQHHVLLLTMKSPLFKSGIGAAPAEQVESAYCQYLERRHGRDRVPMRGWTSPRRSPGTTLLGGRR